jgi:hypothetical protein
MSNTCHPVLAVLAMIALNLAVAVGAVRADEEPTKPAAEPLTLFPISSYVFPGLDGAVEVTLDKSVASAGGEVTVKLMRGEQVLHTAVHGVSEGKSTVVLPMKDLPVGSYICHATIAREGVVRLAASTVIQKPRSHIAFVGPNKMVANNGGEPFFPIGMWMPWPNIDEKTKKLVALQTPEQIVKDLDVVKAAGFNTVVIPEAVHSDAGPAYAKAESLGSRCCTWATRSTSGWAATPTLSRGSIPTNRRALGSSRQRCAARILRGVRLTRAFRSS